jgi:hypothetical protein
MYASTQYINIVSSGDRLFKILLIGFGFLKDAFDVNMI